MMPKETLFASERNLTALAEGEKKKKDFGVIKLSVYFSFTGQNEEGDKSSPLAGRGMMGRGGSAGWCCCGATEGRQGSNRGEERAAPCPQMNGGLRGGALLRVSLFIVFICLLPSPPLPSISPPPPPASPWGLCA